MSVPNGFGSVRILEGSSHVQISNSHFHTSIHGPTFEYQRILDSNVATNAILNAGGRVDIPKCYPGTRKEVISKTERWMNIGYRDDRRIFWLSGPAGAGKSAIVQTLAERCIARQARMANVFFFRADGSRNHSRPVVATLLRQLMRLLPDLKALVHAIIAEDSLIFKTSLREQFTTLINAPIRKIHEETPNTSPIILIFDGLDECDSRSDLDNATKSEQIMLLNVLHELATCPESPFIVLVASRVESHIEAVFNDIGCTMSSIYLDQDYKPGRDIRLYVSAELSRIKRTHPLRHHLPSNWPPAPAMDSIAEKSSGQFIYAATVIRFIAGSPLCPTITIEMVQMIRPAQKHSPFLEIDMLYTFILSRAENWEGASEVIAINDISYEFFESSGPLGLGYSKTDAVSFFADLTSIIHAEISDGFLELSFFHRSFNDFIYTPERAGSFYIDQTSYANSLAPRFILGITYYHYFSVTMDIFKRVNQTSEALTDALTRLPARPLYVKWAGWGDSVKDDFLFTVKKLYAKHDANLYRQIFSHMKQMDWMPDYVYLSDTLSLCDSDGNSFPPDDHDGFHILSHARDSSVQCRELPGEVQDGSVHAAEKPDDNKDEPEQSPQTEPEVQQPIPPSISPKPKQRKWFMKNLLRRFFH